jgi:predicted Zn-dependent protease
MLAMLAVSCPALPAQDLVPPAPSAVAAAATTFQLSADAQKFKFAKIDLQFLKQLDAFDKYIDDKGWVYDDPETTRYVERVGHAVVPPNTPENVKWRFRVLRDPVPNAFALANGSIYINTGLLSRLENEAQLAGVLAHEVTHVFNRHSYLEYHDMRKKAVVVHLLSAAASAAGYAGVNVGIVSALGNLLPAIVVGTMYGYRRELEHEADVYAVGVLKHATYDPMQVSHALELLKKGPEVDLSQHVPFWSDHPKLEDRVRDTRFLANQVGSPENSGKIEQGGYIAAIRNAIRHDAGLALLLGRPRTAVLIAKRLISLEPENPEYYALLGDAYRTLGARTPEPAPEELTDDGKNRARKMLSKMTPPEFDKALLQAPSGKERWETNCGESERWLKKALQLDPQNPQAHRGLGFLYETLGRNLDSIQELRKYLELAPNAKDARQVRQRIETLDKKLSTEPAKPGA